MKKFLLLFSLLVICLVSCKDDENDIGTDIPVTGVSLNNTNTTLEVGSTKILVATIAPESADNKSVTWTSSQPTIASVDNDGLVTALSVGETTVTVTTVDGGFTANCEVTVVGENEPYLSVSPRGESLLFSQDGTKMYLVMEDGSKTEISPVLTVETNIDGWDVELVSDWCYATKDETNNTITLSADVNEGIIGPRTATVVVSAEGVDDIEIAVNQEGTSMGEETGHAAERTSWWRLNVKGAVKSMDYYVEPMAGPLVIENLQFDKYGMLTAFKTRHTVFPDYIDDITITYDDVNHTQIKSIEGTGIAYSKGYYKLIFEYEDHGNYIATEDLFFYMDQFGYYTYWRAWLPQLIKNLKSIKYELADTTEVLALEFYYDFSGGNAELWMKAEDVYGTSMNDPVQELIYSGGYPTSAQYPYYLMANLVTVTATYDISKVDGFFNYYEWVYTMSSEESESFIKRYYSSDYRNSILNVLDIFYLGLSTSVDCTYDNQGNLVGAGEVIKIDYTYDERGNWTKEDYTLFGDNDGTMEIVYEATYDNTIVYY